MLFCFILTIAAAATATPSTSCRNRALASEATPALPLLSQFRAFARTTSSTAPPPCPNRPAPAPLPSPLPAPLAAALSALASLVSSTLNSTTVPGGGLSLTLGGVPLLSLHQGLATKSPPAPVTPSTLFRVASVSKVFPALLAHLGASNGSLNLDAPVAPLLPGFAPRNPFDGGAPTLRQLMSHTSGLQREAPPGADTAEVLAAVSRALLVFPPGAQPSYSNLGFAVLGYALEGAAGGGALLPALVRAAITAPLALNSTGYEYDAAVMARLAAGFDAFGNEVPFSYLGWWYAAGSMYSTAADLDALAQAALAAPGSGLAMSPSSVRELFAPVFWARDGRSGMGTPWEMLLVSNYSVRIKGGNLPGYTAALAVVPEVGLSLAATFNGGLDEFAFVAAALGPLLPALELAFEAQRPQPYNPGPTPGDYVGVFALQGTTTVVEQLGSGALVWRNSALGLSLALDWVGSDDVQSLDLFRAAFPDSSFSCLIGELDGFKGQYVAFLRDCDSGNVTGTSWPGIVPGAVWVKT